MKKCHIALNTISAPAVPLFNFPFQLSCMMSRLVDEAPVSGSAGGPCDFARRRTLHYITTYLRSSGDRDSVELSKFSKGSDRISTGSVQSAGSYAHICFTLNAKVSWLAPFPLTQYFIICSQRKTVIFPLRQPCGIVFLTLRKRTGYKELAGTAPIWTQNCWTARRQILSLLRLKQMKPWKLVRHCLDILCLLIENVHVVVLAFTLGNKWISFILLLHNKASPSCLPDILTMPDS